MAGDQTLDEDRPLAPSTLNGHSKAMVEQLLVDMYVGPPTKWRRPAQASYARNEVRRTIGKIVDY